MTTYIYVHPSTVKANAKQNRNDPPVIVVQDDRETRCFEVELLGPSAIRYSNGERPTGARVWLETESDVILHGG